MESFCCHGNHKCSPSFHIQQPGQPKNTEIEIIVTVSLLTHYHCLENWQNIKKLEQKLQVFINNCLRQILCPLAWSNRSPLLTYETRLWYQKPITETIKEREIDLGGGTHPHRGPESIVWYALDWKGQRMCNRACSVTTWRRMLDTELNTRGCPWDRMRQTVSTCPRQVSLALGQVCQ